MSLENSIHGLTIAPRGSMEEMTVTWFSAEETDRIGLTWENESGEGEEYGVTGTYQEKDKRYKHVFRVKTDPDRARHYRILSDGAEPVGGRIPRRIPQGAPHTMIFTADTQCWSEEPNLWREGLQTAARYADGDLYIHGGDFVQVASDIRMWDDMMDAPRDYLAGTPLLPVCGNHCYQDLYMADYSGFLSLHFSVSHPEQYEHRGIYYALDVGTVHYIILNTGDLVLADPCEGLTAKQLAFLERELESPQPFRVVVTHHPAYSRGMYGGPDNDEKTKCLRCQIQALSNYEKIDLFLQAHDHMYCATYPLLRDGTPTQREITAPSPVYRAGGGTVYTVIPPCGCQRRGIDEDSDPVPFRVAFDTPENSLGFQILRADASRLSLRTYLHDFTTGEDRMLDSFAIEK